MHSFAAINKMVKLKCHRVLFYSPTDEAIFFDFIKRIKAIRRFKGIGKDLFLYVKTPVSEKSLWDLKGLFRRYRIASTQLKKLKVKAK
jgi:hypothetical protein